MKRLLWLDDIRNPFNKEIVSFIQSLQKTEWDVEVEMETINQDYRFDVGQITRPKITNNSIRITKVIK